MVRYKLIGIGETDEHGVARMTKNAQGEPISGYVGAGVGEVDVVASLDNPINDSSIVSKISRIFDCPIFDGDNTPTSISWSKTNNAVVTDEVVSLIASVLNTNDNPCINIPVVFKQGNTVLGTAYTDCNGDATITYTWADSDIFNVTAQVGQSLSEDITMFVKDKLNLLPHNVWTCGDYTKNLNGFTVNPDNQNLFIDLDNTFVVNGDNNILIHRLTQQAYYAQAYYTYTLNPEDYGKTFIFTANVKNNLNGGCSIQIAGDSLKYSSIPKDSEGVFSITYSNVTSNNIRVVVAFAGAVTGKVYFDNLVLNVIDD